MLFDGTIGDNIACGDTRYSTLQVIDAAKLARAHKFITEMPDGMNTTLGRTGRSLDGGQSFRIGLARALLRDPSCLVLLEPRLPDDATQTTQLDESLRLAAEGRTTVVIPSRQETLRHVTRVYVIHEGKLLESCALYRHLNSVRFDEFGIADQAARSRCEGDGVGSR